MKRNVVLLCLCNFYLIHSVTHFVSSESLDGDVSQSWRDFKNKSGLVFDDTHVEDERRRIFEQNYARIVGHNEAPVARGFRLDASSDFDFSVGLNEFATMSDEEFQRTLGLPERTEQELQEMKEIIANETRQEERMRASKEVPDSWNWCTKNACTRVKSQGTCGGCWAFTITGAIESQYLNKFGTEKLFSEQQLIDCTLRNANYKTYGCKGGWPDSGFKYLKTNALTEESAYPYRARETACRQPRTTTGTIKSYGLTRLNDEEHLKWAVANFGPVAIAMDASHWSLRFYTGGIYSEPKCNKYSQNHAVLVVGYGSLGGKDYWLIKNSWGPAWGESGYFKLARNKNNMCGVATYGAYPVL